MMGTAEIELRKVYAASNRRRTRIHLLVYREGFRPVDAPESGNPYRARTFRHPDTGQVVRVDDDGRMVWR